MAKVNVHAERAARLVDGLRQRRDERDEYPLTVARLRERVEPGASDEDVLKALGHKSHSSAVVRASNKDVSSPVALAEDVAVLAASPLLVEYALGKLAREDAPLHPVNKVVAQVEKPLRPAFEAALNEKLAGNNLPGGVGQRTVRGKAQLYLERFPPPPLPKTPAAELAEKLVAGLEARRQQGQAVAALGDLVPADVTPALVKKAVEEETFRGQAVLVPVSKTLSLAALQSEREALLGGDLLLEELLAARTTSKKPFAAVADLAGVLPEELREAFTARLTHRLEQNALPESVLGRGEGDQRLLALERNLSAGALLGHKVMAELRHRRQSGGGYPASPAVLAATAAPQATPEQVAELLADKAFKAQVLLSIPGDIHAPIALPGDETRLASNPLLVERAVRLLSTREEPLHPLTKVAGKLDKALKEAFPAAVDQHITGGTLPGGVVAHEVKGKVHLRLAEYEPPPPPVAPEKALAEKLLGLLRSAREAGGTSYPVVLSEVIEQAGHQPSEKVVKTALATDAIRSGAVVALPGVGNSLAVLAGDQERLASDARLLPAVLAAVGTEDNQAQALPDLVKKLSREVAPGFTAVVERDLEAGTLPPGVGCLQIKKRPHLFLLADVGKPIARREAPAKAEVPPPEPAAPPAPRPIDFGRMFDDAFRRLDQAGHNQVSLVELRKEVPVERDLFDSGLDQLRRSGQYTLTGAEGRHGLSEEERAAGIHEHGDLLLYVSRRVE